MRFIKILLTTEIPVKQQAPVSPPMAFAGWYCWRTNSASSTTIIPNKKDTHTDTKTHKHIYIHSRKPTKHSINRKFQKSAHLLANCRLLRRRDTCCKSFLNLFLDVTLAQWITGDSNSLSWQKYCLPVLLFRGLSFVGIYTVQ